MTGAGQRRATFTQIWASVVAGVVANAGLVVSVIGMLSIGNVVLDATGSPQLSTLIGSAGTFAAQIFVTRTVLGRYDPTISSPRVGGFFLLNILTTLGVGIGLVILVLPGLYLAARWLLAGPILLRDGAGTTTAMRGSWEMTAPHAWPIAGLLLVLWAVAALTIVASGVLAGLMEHGMPHMEIAASFISYLMMFGALVVSWIAAVAIFDLLRPADEDLTQIFS